MRPMRLLTYVFSKREGAGSSRVSEPNKESTHVWVRWWWVWHVAFYVLLAVSLVSSLADFGLTGRPQLAIVVLSLSFAIWYWAMIVRPGWPESRLAAIVYLGVAVLFWASLATLHPAYQMLLFVLFAQIYTLLPMRWAIPASVLLTAIIVLRGILQTPGEPYAWIYSGVFATAVGSFFALWINSIIDQSEERQRLIEELEATRKELASEERRAGILEERGRLAREIHDTLAQGFISIVTHLEAAEEELSPRTGPAQRHLDQALHAARENLVETRRLVAALRPEILEGSSLPEALGRLAARWSEASGVPVEVTVTGDQTTLPQEFQVALLRVAQEALSNARKHARANRVTITLSYLEDLAVLDVQDDGVGFDPLPTSSDGPNGGFGLRAMRERVEGLGGRLLVESTLGEGTTLAVQLPLGTVHNPTEAQGAAP